MPVSTAVVGRQPIVGRDRAVIGYELLFRALETSTSAQQPLPDGTPEEIRAVAADGDAMSVDVVRNTMGIGMERVIGSKLAFCNADRGMLTGRFTIALPPERTVVEVLESVVIDDELLDGCRALRSSGYRLAADDFCWFDGAERLLELMDIVKIDLRLTPPDAVEPLMVRCGAFGVRLLAEKVETEDELTRCMDLGFDLFQGYLLGRPNTITSPALGPSRQGVLQLAGALLASDADFDRLEQILRTEPALAYRLLQLAAIGRLGEMKRQVHSIREALVMVGLTRLRGWLPALLLRPAGPSVDTALPTVLSRARLAELLANRLFPAECGYAFAAGMLSAFDLLLGIDHAHLIEALEVPGDLREAAFGGSSGVGRLIAAVTDYQLEGRIPTGLPGIAAEDVNMAAARAFSWAVHMTHGLDAVA
jgi:EAL and modified HD-GYP domain-containing signal transduction protein